MREITLFKMEPEYVLGDVQNISTLNEKIHNDEVLLKQIEQDYNVNQKKYQKEYVAAKINHLRNMYLYHWLILKKYFEEALFSEMETFPDYQKEEMKKRGWMFPQSFINCKITTSGNVGITTEELYIKEFDRLFDNLFVFNVGEENSRIDRYYKQAIFNYKNKCYYSCVVSLFPIIESYHQFITNFNKNQFYRIKDNLNCVGEKIKTVQQIFTQKISYYINLVNHFNDLAKNHYFSVSLDRLKEPEIINRNRIAHGIFSREISQKDCLQLFCVISNMITIKTIIDVNEQMNKIFEELNHLKKTEIK